RKRKFYTQTRYGYARGDEALNYVENIRRYYQSIIGYEQAHSLPPTDDIAIVDGLNTIQPPAVSESQSTLPIPPPPSTTPSDEVPDIWANKTASN
ncbi:hypothetical protein ACOV11_26795, partial [Vibrio natriegens]